MTAPRWIMGAAFAAVTLAGFSGMTTPSAPSPTATAPSPEAVTEVPVATEVVVSLEGISILDQNGAPMRSATFDGPDAALALVSELTGSTPEPVDQQKFGTYYNWPGITVGVQRDSWVVITAPMVAGLPIATSDGIHVGSARSDVEALSPVEEAFDGDGDGLPDILGIEPLPVPGSGTAYIRVFFDGATVERIIAPSGDYGEI